MPFSLSQDFVLALPPSGSDSQSSSLDDVQSRRSTFASTLKPLLSKSFPGHPAVSKTDYHISSADGHPVLLRWYLKPSSNVTSAFLFIHSGGLILGDVETFNGLVEEYVNQSGVPYLSVEYRLAPEFPYPKALEDVYAGLLWLHKHARELAVDPKRIGVHGESAGGGLAAALAIYAQEKQGPAIAKQILIYPMLDDRVTSADAYIQDYLVWSACDNETGWRAYLGESQGTDGVAATGAAARLQDVTGLPPVYAEVGELDLFRDQVVQYVQKFWKSGISAELRVYPGAPHSFEWFAPTSKTGIAAMLARKEAARSI